MISDVLGEAFDVYRLLWRRAVLVAALVFVVVELANALAYRGSSAAELVSLALALIGGLLVQGSLVEAVRDLREGRPPAPPRDYYDRTRGRLGTLLGASLLYGIGVAVGFLLLVVPGLIAVARWSLIVPLVVIEKRDVRDAFARSSELVRGQTGRVLVVIVASALLGVIGGYALHFAFGSLPRFWAIWIGGTIASAFTVPYQAFVLTVLYYRLSGPGRAVAAEIDSAP